MKKSSPIVPAIRGAEFRGSGLGPCLMCSWLLLALAIPSAVLAQPLNLNRNLLPLGDREAFTANAGAGRRGSNTAAYYNPAGLFYVDHASVSASGSTYLFLDTEQTPRGPSALPIQSRAEGVSTIPSTIAVSRRYGEWAFSLNVLVPESFELRTLQTADFGTVYTATAITEQDEDLWLGGAAAYGIADWLSVGISGFVIRSSGFETAFSVAQFGQPTNPPLPGPGPSFLQPDAVGLSTSYFNAEVWSVAGGAGLLWSPFEWLDIGAGVTSRSLQQSHEAELYTTTVTASAGTLSTRTAYYPDLAMNYRLPLDARMGFGIRPAESLLLLLDVGWQDGESYAVIRTNEATRQVSTENTYRCMLGAEWQFSERFTLLGGLLYNPSAVRAVSQATHNTRQDYRGASLGITYTDELFRLSFGVYYLSGRGDALARAENLSGYFDVRTSAYSFMVSSAYFI